MSSAALKAQTYWGQALATPHGLGLTVSDPARAKGQLYAARRALLPAIPKLEAYTIRTSPDNPAFELWLLYDPTKDPTLASAPPSDPSSEHA